MEVKNCKRCNKIFNYYSGYPLCDECKSLDDETYRKVRDYVKANPGVTIAQVSKELGVSRQLIIRYLHEEKLEVKDKSSAGLIWE